MGRHAAGDFRHRGEQRQRSLRARHRLIGDGGHAGGYEILGLRTVGSEMEISEQDLPAPEFLALGRERLLHLDDHLRAREHRICVGGNFGAGRLVIRIRQAGAQSGIGLDNDTMALHGEFVHRRGHEPDAVFVVLDLFRHANKHDQSRIPVPHCMSAVEFLSRHDLDPEARKADIGEPRR